MKFLTIIRLIPLITGLVEAYKQAKADGKLSVEEILLLLEHFIIPIAKALGTDIGDELPAIAPELQAKVDEARATAEILEQVLN